MKKDMLEEYLFLRKEIGLLDNEHEELVSGKLMASKISGMPSSGKVVDFTADYACRLYELTSLVAKKLNELVALRLEIEAWVDELPLPYRIILRLVYIEGLSWEDAAEYMNYSRRHLQRLHKEALVLLGDK